MLRSREQQSAALMGVLYWFAAIAYWELVLHIAALGELKAQFGFVLGFSFVFACALALLQSFLPNKLRFAGNVIATAVLTVLYGSQLVYYFVFATLYSVSMIQQGGAAVTSFWKETVVTMWEKLPWLLSLLAPMLALCLLRKFRRMERMNGIWRGILIGAAALVQAATVACVSLGGTGYFTDYYYYHSDTATTDQAASRFGLLTAFRVDIFGTNREVEEQEDVSYYIPDAEPETVTEYNVLEFDFDALNSGT